MNVQQLNEGLARASSLDTKLDVLYDWVDRALWERRLGMLNEYLCVVATATLRAEPAQDIDLSLGLLTAAYPAMTKLPGWSTLATALRHRLPPELLSGF